MKPTMINDEAISFKTLRKFQVEIALRDRQIAFLMEALQNTIDHAQAVLQALQESNALDQHNT